MAGTDYQAADTDLTNLASNVTAGLWAVTVPGTSGAARTITCVTGETLCTNGNGVSGNPTIGAGANAVLTSRTNVFGAFLQDFSAASLKLPMAAAAAPATSGVIQVDSTSWTVEVGLNGINRTFAMIDGNIATATALAANGTNGALATADFALGVDASGNAETGKVAKSAAAGPGVGSCDFPGQVFQDTRTFSPGTAGYTYYCPTAGATPVQIAIQQDSYTTVQGNSGSATPAGGSTLSVLGDGTILNCVAANGSPDTLTCTIQAASIPPSKMTAGANTFEIVYHLYGTGASNVIEDTQDVPLLYPNESTTKTITQIKAWTDTGATTINVQRDDGSAADICTSNLVASASGVTCTLSATEKVISNGHKVGLVVVTGATSGTPTHLILSIVGTKGDS